VNGAGGYVRSYRSLLSHPAFRNEGEAMAFNWLVLKAAWKPARVRYKERVIYLQRGQLAVSVRDMANALERSRSWAERFLNRLKIETMIETRVETGVNVITVCNYSVYQGEGQESETPAKTAAETPPRQGRDTEQRKEKPKEKDSPQTPQGAKQTFLPADWKPPPPASLSPKAKQCAEQWSTDAYERVAESFAAFWQSRNRKMLDWEKTWAGWVIREHWRVMQEARQQASRGEGQPSWRDALIGANGGRA
jgi:hypothetical protein